MLLLLVLPLMLLLSAAAATDGVAFASASEVFSSCWRPNLSWWWVKESLVRIIGKWRTSRENCRRRLRFCSFFHSISLLLLLALALFLRLSSFVHALTHIHTHTVHTPPHSVTASVSLCLFSTRAQSMSMSMCQPIPLILRFNGFETFILLFSLEVCFFLFCFILHLLYIIYPIPIYLLWVGECIVIYSLKLALCCFHQWKLLSCTFLVRLHPFVFCIVYCIRQKDLISFDLPRVLSSLFFFKYFG